jgi:hypothetical protein
VIRNRVGSHSTGYLRYEKAGEHLHHPFEVFIRCLQGGRHNIFLLLMIFFRWNAENCFLLKLLETINPLISEIRPFLLQLP